MGEVVRLCRTQTRSDYKEDGPPVRGGAAPDRRRAYRRRRVRHGDTCSIAEDYSLSEGEVLAEECEMECWKHGSTFDLRTGEPRGTLAGHQGGPGVRGASGGRRCAGGAPGDVDDQQAAATDSSVQGLRAGVTSQEVLRRASTWWCCSGEVHAVMGPERVGEERAWPTS